jgi:splicing factor U2AF 35 kDa subunit
VHNKPLFSQCINLTHMYINPMAGVVTSGGKLSRDQEREIQDKFEDFYQDVFDEAAKFGEIDDLIVLDNLGDHLIGESCAHGWACVLLVPPKPV